MRQALANRLAAPQKAYHSVTAVWFWGIYPVGLKTNVQAKTLMWMFLTFRVADMWMQSALSINWRANKTQCLQTATEGIEVLLRARIGANLANVKTNERSQVQNSLVNSVLDGGPVSEGRWETERGRLSLLYCRAPFVLNFRNKTSWECK